MNSSMRSVLVAILACLALASLAGWAGAQCPPSAFAGGYSGSPYGYAGSPYGASLPPLVTDSSFQGGFVSSPFSGMIPGYRCRLICYPVSQSGGAASFGAPSGFAPSYQSYIPGGIPVGSGGLPYGNGGGFNVTYYAR